MSDNEKIDLANWAVNQAIKCGADQAAVSISKRREVEVEFRDSKLDKLKESTQNALGLKIYVQNRYSSHSTNDLRKDSLEKLVNEVIISTKYLTEDKYRSLPDTDLYPQNIEIDLKIRDFSYENIEASERKEMTAAIETVAREKSDQIISTTAGYSDVHTETIRVHSTGFWGQIEGTMFTAGAEVTVRDGDSGRPADWYFASTRLRKNLPLPEKLGVEAARRALRKVGQKKIESGQYKMIVENRSGGQLFSTLYTPMQAKNLQQKNSFLEGMLNKKIASDLLTVKDDPLLAEGLGSRIFDGEGIAGHKRYMIENGILQNYYIDDYYGKKLGMRPNSGSISNLVFNTGTKSLDEMIYEMDMGILITGFIGGNSNSTTGDFSFGIVGFLVEKGELVQPINEMNITGNAKDFWNKLVAVGNDPYPYSSWRMPSLMFEQIHFSGI
jgi:PmbA protein